MTDSNQSGGIEFGGDASLGGDAVGRDKIVQNITQQTVPAEPIHNSLPNQPYFFGRAAELARIADALDPEAQGWGVLISGPGGIGKTSLAVRAAHLAPKKTFPIEDFSLCQSDAVDAARRGEVGRLSTAQLRRAVGRTGSRVG